MNRTAFLRKTGLLVGALAIGKLPTLHHDGQLIPAPLELGVIRDSRLHSTNDFQVFAETFGECALVESGGLCAPVSPFYTLTGLTSRPVRDALPSFTAKR